MKNIQIIDGANNCTFPIFQVTDEEFVQIFPESGQDIELIEDFIARTGNEAVGTIMRPVWERPILKSKIQDCTELFFTNLSEGENLFQARSEKRIGVVQ